MNDHRSGDFDEIDLALIEAVEEDFDVSLEILAEKLDLSKSAVHYRLNKLKENEVITGVTADIDPRPFGLDMVAITEISVTHEEGYSVEIGSQLAEIEGVEQTYYTMGDVDFITIMRVQNRAQMNEVIETMVAIDGVNETSSQFVMAEIKSNPQVVTNMSDETRTALLQADD